MKVKLKQIEALGFDNIFKNITGTAPNQTIVWNGTEWVLSLPPNVHGLQNVLTVSNASNTINHILLQNNRIGLGKYTGGSENRNITFGKEALNSNLEGNNNIAFGNEALYSNTHGNNLIGIGYLAGRSSINVSNLIYIGTRAGYQNVGGNNIIIGHNSLESTNSTNNIIIGNNIKALSKNNYFALGIADDKILVEGDFLNKKLEIKGSLEVNSKIREVIRNVYSIGENEILIRNKTTGFYEVLPSNPNQVLTTNSTNYLSWRDLSSAITLPIATSTILGGIKVGTNLSISLDGTLSANNFYNSNGTLFTDRSVNGNSKMVTFHTTQTFSISNRVGFVSTNNAFVLNFGTSDQSTLAIRTNLLTSLRTVQFQDFSGTVALLSNLEGLRFYETDLIGTDYTLSDLDCKKILRVNSPIDITLTVSESLSIGFNVIVIQEGVGKINIIAGGSSVINNVDSFFTSKGEWSRITIEKLESGISGQVIVSGDLE